jgi:PIN like domain
LRMSSDKRPEFFFDRSLGKITARRLREAGYAVRLIADFYGDDAKETPDEEWIAEGCRRGWLLLTKDKRIRYRTAELAALEGHLFCLVDGNASIEDMTLSLVAALPRIVRAAAQGASGFWHVYLDGHIRKMWP